MCIRDSVNRPLPTYWLVHWHSRERLLEHAVRKLHNSYSFTNYKLTRGELDQLGYIRRVRYRFAPLCFCFVFFSEFLFFAWLKLTMLRFWSYKFRFYWFYICAYVENTFAFMWQFFCAFITMPYARSLGLQILTKINEPTKKTMRKRESGGPMNSDIELSSQDV